MITGQAWTRPDVLQCLKTLILDCEVRLEINSFATIVDVTPQLENFSSVVKACPYLGIAGLRPTDLLAVVGWSRLRTCHMALDVTGKDVAAPPSSKRKFVKLTDAGLVPGLVRTWKEKLTKLQEMDVFCRYVVDDNYVLGPGDDINLFPLIYGSRCDAGRIHFWTDANDAAEENLGFLNEEDD